MGVPPLHCTCPLYPPPRFPRIVAVPDVPGIVQGFHPQCRHHRDHPLVPVFAHIFASSHGEQGKGVGCEQTGPGSLASQVDMHVIGSGVPVPPLAKGVDDPRVPVCWKWSAQLLG